LGNGGHDWIFALCVVWWSVVASIQKGLVVVT